MKADYDIKMTEDYDANSPNNEFCSMLWSHGAHSSALTPAAASRMPARVTACTQMLRVRCSAVKKLMPQPAGPHQVGAAARNL